MVTLRQTYRQEQEVLQEEIEAQMIDLARRREKGLPVRRCLRSLQSRQRRLDDLMACFQRRQCRLLERIARRRARRSELRRELAERWAARDAIDTESLCRERDLEKDRIMRDVYHDASISIIVQPGSCLLLTQRVLPLLLLRHFEIADLWWEQ